MTYLLYDVLIRISNDSRTNYKMNGEFFYLINKKASSKRLSETGKRGAGWRLHGTLPLNYLI